MADAAASFSDYLARIDVSWQRWLATLDVITPEQREAPGTCGVWSVRDLIAHVGIWDGEAAGKVRGILEGADRPEPTESVDAFNERTLGELDGRSIDEVTARMHAAHEHLRVALRTAHQSTSGEALQWVEWATANDTWKHYDEHRDQILIRFHGPA